MTRTGLLALPRTCGINLGTFFPGGNPMVRGRFAVVGLVILSVLLVAGRVRGAEEWTEPKDGLFTEKQVQNYAAAQKDVLQLLKAMGKAVEGSKTGFGAAAVLAGMDDK